MSFKTLNKLLKLGFDHCFLNILQSAVEAMVQRGDQLSVGRHIVDIWRNQLTADSAADKEESPRASHYSPHIDVKDLLRALLNVHPELMVSSRFPASLKGTTLCLERLCAFGPTQLFSVALRLLESIFSFPEPLSQQHV